MSLPSSPAVLYVHGWEGPNYDTKFYWGKHRAAMRMIATLCIPASVDTM